MDWLLGHNGSILILCLYFAATTIVGLVAWRFFPQSDAEGYILGGRGMGWIVAAFTLMATQYSALTFLAFPGTIYRTGLGGYVFITGMYIGVSAFFWLLFAARTWKVGRAFGHMTPADTFTHFYGCKGAGTVLALLLIATLIPYIQVQIIGIAYLLEVATNGLLSFQTGTFLVYALMTSYVFMGGLRAVAWTDTMQGILLLGGVVLGAGFVLFSVGGGPAEVVQKVSVSNPDWLGLPGPGGAWPILFLVTFALPVGLGWPMQPQMWLKMHIPRNVSYIRLWPLWVTISFPIVMGAALLVGMTGQVAKPGLTDTKATDTIMLTMLIENFPPLLSGLVAAAGLAAMMSTVSSQIHSVGASVLRDFFVRWWPEMPAKRQVGFMRVIVILVGLLGLYLSLTQPSRLTQLGIFSAAWAAQVAPAGIAALCGWRWATKWGALAGALSGSALLLYMVFANMREWQGVYAGFWALLVNTALFVLVSLLTPKDRANEKVVEQYRLVGW